MLTKINYDAPFFFFLAQSDNIISVVQFNDTILGCIQFNSEFKETIAGIVYLFYSFGENSLQFVDIGFIYLQETFAIARLKILPFVYQTE